MLKKLSHYIWSGRIWPYNEFGDEGHKDSTNINFIKGRLFVNVYFKHFDSDETPKRFAEYTLKAIQGQ